jgi:hypothetical protein
VSLFHDKKEQSQSNFGFYGSFVDAYYPSIITADRKLLYSARGNNDHPDVTFHGMGFPY